MDKSYLISFQFEECEGIRIANRVRIDETIQVELASGRWVVTNPDGHPSWHGEHTYKNLALLEYLKTRLGFYPGEEE